MGQQGLVALSKFSSNRGRGKNKSRHRKITGNGRSATLDSNTFISDTIEFRLVLNKCVQIKNDLEYTYVPKLNGFIDGFGRGPIESRTGLVDKRFNLVN